MNPSETNPAFSRRLYCTAALLLGLTLLARPALAHFGMIIPESNVVSKEDAKTFKLHLLFWHPMENGALSLEKPKLEVLDNGQRNDLSSALREQAKDAHKTWQAEYQVKKPGDLVFSMTPQAYWEPAEGKFIIHYTKTVVSALGSEEGWDKPVGSKMEILPLTRPYGLYAPGSFSGKALFKGKSAANCDVEIEYYNESGKLKAPSEPYTTLKLKTDANGVFTFCAPWAGWWGFAALHDDEAKLKKDGIDKNVELGGIIWVYFHPALK